MDSHTGLPLTEICLVFQGFKQHGLIQPDEEISAHYISVDSNGRFNLQITNEDVDAYTSTVYRKIEGYCTTVPSEMEFLSFECGTANCKGLGVGKSHNLVIRVSNFDSD